MFTRFRLPLFTLAVAMIVVVASGSAWPVAAAQPALGLYGPTNNRAADAVLYLYMHETTSLQANGDGEEMIEFLVTNPGLTPINKAEFKFRVPSTDYWGIEAWDVNGSLDYRVVVKDDEVHITIQFRDSVGFGERYRYFFTISFPGLAVENSGEWAMNGETTFTVAEFVRTVNLPDGSVVTYVNPTPTEQANVFVRWVRYVMLQFSFQLRFSLTELTKQELAEMFAPYFLMHEEDIYVPMDVNLALNHAECIPSDGGTASDICDLRLLGGSWLTLEDSYIDFEGDPGREPEEMGSSEKFYSANIQANVTPQVYARIYDVPGNDYWVIQYWLYYYYNSWGHRGGFQGWLGLHEGDWEMIQVVLTGNFQPEYVAYAQHTDIFSFLGIKGGSKRGWGTVKLDRETNKHPIVFVALGSHASYFSSGRFMLNKDETAPESENYVKPEVHLLQASDPWVSYRGKWGQPGDTFFVGDYQGGPSSPGRQDNKWLNPYNWSENKIDWDGDADYHEGKTRIRIDAVCNVGLLNKENGQFFGWRFNEFISEIDDGDYIVNESTGINTIILHNSYKQSGELFTLFATCSDDVAAGSRQPAAPVNLTVEMYDAGADELVTAVFELPANWTPATTIATLEFTEGASPVLEVDRDNNGSIDEIVPPESVTSEPIEEPSGAGRLFVPVVRR